ncbi:hypothetical protein GCM10025773_29540 [Microbacterium jejuense]
MKYRIAGTHISSSMRLSFTCCQNDFRRRGGVASGSARGGGAVCWGASFRAILRLSAVTTGVDLDTKNRDKNNPR